MEKTLKIGIIQQHNSGDVCDNRARLADKARALAAAGARLIVNQELHDSLYSVRRRMLIYVVWR